MNPSDYLAQDAMGLAALIATRQASAAEVLEAALERMAAANPRLNAVTLDLSEAARAVVKYGAPGGPLGGVPFLLKDLGANLKGTATTSGSRLFKGNVAGRHSAITAAYKRAGLVIFGKTRRDHRLQHRQHHRRRRGPARPAGGTWRDRRHHHRHDDQGQGHRRPRICAGHAVGPRLRPRGGDLFRDLRCVRLLDPGVAADPHGRTTRPAAGPARLRPAPVRLHAQHPGLQCHRPAGDERVPLGWSRGGLPIGVQFVGRGGDEATLLRLAGQLEAAAPWAGKRPKGFGGWGATAATTAQGSSICLAQGGLQRRAGSPCLTATPSELSR